MRDRTVRLPRSSYRRNAPGYVKLLCGVEANASSGFSFHGKFLRPGDHVPETALWPDADYPERPLLIEAVQLDFSGRGHRRNPLVYILWVYDPDAREWIELARTQSVGPEWVYDLAPIVLRELRLRTRPQRRTLNDVAVRIRSYLEAELQPLRDVDRLAVLCFLHDEFAAGIARDLRL